MHATQSLPLKRPDWCDLPRVWPPREFHWYETSASPAFRENEGIIAHLIITCQELTSLLFKPSCQLLTRAATSVCLLGSECALGTSCRWKGRRPTNKNKTIMTLSYCSVSNVCTWEHKPAWESACLSRSWRQERHRWIQRSTAQVVSMPHAIRSHSARSQSVEKQI